MALQDDPPESAPHDPAARKVGRRGRRVGSWLTGILLLLALVLVVGHLGEGERLVALLREVRPGWLVVATALQLGTYVCAAAVWHRALATAATRPRLRELVPLGLAKLFTDQAIPSAGVSGTVLVVRALGRRGIPRGRAMSAMLVSLASYYLAYGLAVAGALAVLWRLGALDPVLLVLATVLGVIAGVVPGAVFGFGRRLGDHLPAALIRIPAVGQAARMIADLPPGRLVSPRLAVETVGFQLGIFVLDAATLAVMLAAVGVPASPALSFASFVFASVVATLAWVPGGLGTFEGTCVAMLSTHDIPLEAALAATLLLRGFTFWLPMLPGLWLARREMTGAPAQGRSSRDVA